MLVRASAICHRSDLLGTEGNLAPVCFWLLRHLKHHVRRIQAWRVKPHPSSEPRQKKKLSKATWSYRLLLSCLLAVSRRLFLVSYGLDQIALRGSHHPSVEIYDDARVFTDIRGNSLKMSLSN